MSLLAQRIIAVIVWSIAIFEVWGGQYVYREDLPDGGNKTWTLYMYWRLPPPPKGPRFCHILDAGSVALSMPCDFKPPFVGWLQGGKY